METIMKILLFGMFFIALHSFGDSASECYYMPFNCDLVQPVKSTMTIDFISEKSHSPMPLKTIIAEHDGTDEWHAVWKIFIDAVSQNDPQILSNFFAKEDNIVNTPQKILNWYHKNYAKMKLLSSEIELVRCINGDNQKIFLWGVKKDDKYIIAGELFFKVGNRIFWQWNPARRGYIGVLCDLFRDGNVTKAEDTRYQYSFVPTVDNRSVPFRFRFNGKKYDNVDITKVSEKDKNEDEIIKFYHETTLAFRKPEEYANFFTALSRKRFLDHASRFPDYINAYWQENQNNPKQIVFVIDANPVFLVFFRRNNSGNSTFNDFDYVLKTKDGLKFTNYGYSDDLDGLLRSNLPNLRTLVQHITEE